MHGGWVNEGFEAGELDGGKAHFFEYYFQVVRYETGTETRSLSRVKEPQNNSLKQIVRANY